MALDVTPRTRIYSKATANVHLHQRNVLQKKNHNNHLKKQHLQLSKHKKNFTYNDNCMQN